MKQIAINIFVFFLFPPFFFFFFFFGSLDIDREVRLVGGSEAFGRVEVNYEELWGTVCDYGWSFVDAKVICTQLGFPSTGQHGVTYDAYFGEGTGNIWLDSVSCYGNEKNIRECSHRGWGVYTCTHRDDAGVFCDRGKLY